MSKRGKCKKLSYNSEYLLELWGRVQNRDRKAEIELREIHKCIFPNSSLYVETIPGKSSYRRELLHTMYLHLVNFYN